MSENLLEIKDLSIEFRTYDGVGEGQSTICSFAMDAQREGPWACGGNWGR